MLFNAWCILPCLNKDDDDDDDDDDDGWNTSPKNARTKHRTDLNLREIVYISIIFYMSDSEPY